MSEVEPTQLSSPDDFITGSQMWEQSVLEREFALTALLSDCHPRIQKAVRLMMLSTSCFGVAEMTEDLVAHAASAASACEPTTTMSERLAFIAAHLPKVIAKKYLPLAVQMLDHPTVAEAYALQYLVHELIRVGIFRADHDRKEEKHQQAILSLLGAASRAKEAASVGLVLTAASLKVVFEMEKASLSENDQKMVTEIENSKNGRPPRYTDEEVDYVKGLHRNGEKDWAKLRAAAKAKNYYEGPNVRAFSSSIRHHPRWKTS